MSSHKFSEQIILQQSPEFIFDYTLDYNNRLNWDTFLIEAHLMNGATKADKGVRAWCVAKNKLGMETEYVSFRRPHVTAIKMTKGPYMFRDFLGSWTFKEINSTTTEVIFLYSFSLRFPFNIVGYFIRMNLRNNVRQRLRDLKKCVEKR